ncbi:thymidine kinase [Brevibacterium casei]|nr:thymidine kinase [Brevibacterium casei]
MGDQVAKLYFRYGAMNSGKSTAPLQAAFNYEERGRGCRWPNPTSTRRAPTRSSPASASPAPSTSSSPQAPMSSSSTASTPTTSTTTPLIESIDAPKAPVACLLIDEAQFLEPEQVDSLMRIATDASVPVMCYGIRTDFRTRAFPGSARLLEIAHTLEELKTICRAGGRRCSTAASSTGGSSSTAIRSPSTATP